MWDRDEVARYQRRLAEQKRKHEQQVAGIEAALRSANDAINVEKVYTHMCLYVHVYVKIVCLYVNVYMYVKTCVHIHIQVHTNVPTTRMHRNASEACVSAHVCARAHTHIKAQTTRMHRTKTRV